MVHEEYREMSYPKVDVTSVDGGEKPAGGTPGRFGVAQPRSRAGAGRTGPLGGGPDVPGVRRGPPGCEHGSNEFVFYDGPRSPTACRTTATC